MNYTEWEKGMPAVIREDVLWKMMAYRFSLFLPDICREDASEYVVATPLDEDVPF